MSYFKASILVLMTYFKHFTLWKGKSANIVLSQKKTQWNDNSIIDINHIIFNIINVHL